MTVVETTKFFMGTAEATGGFPWFTSTGQLKLQFEENLLARITCFGIDVEDVLAPDVDVRPGCANLLAGQTGHVVRHFLVHYQVPLT